MHKKVQFISLIISFALLIQFNVLGFTTSQSPSEASFNTSNSVLSSERKLQSVIESGYSTPLFTPAVTPTPTSSYFDDYGNTLDSAYLLSEDTIYGTIIDSKDKDVFKVIPASDQMYVFSLSHNNEVRYTLFDSDGTVICDNESYNGIDYIEQYMTKNKVYYFMVMYATCNSFKVDYNISAFSTEDDYSNNMENAIEVKVNSAINGYSTFNTDVDYLYFVPEASGVHEFNKYEKGNYDNINFSADILDSSGTVLQSKDNYYNLIENEKYYIRVSNEDYANIYISYSLLIRPILDDYSNDFGTAKNIQFDNSVSGTLEYIYDTDCFSFQPIDQGVYCLEVLSNNYPDLCYYLNFFDSTGKELIFSYTDQKAYLHVLSGQRYYLEVSTNLKDSYYYNSYHYPFLYSFKINGPISDDYGDTFSNSEPIELEQPIKGSYDYFGDYDFFSFTAPAKICRIVTDFSTSMVELYNSPNVLIAESKSFVDQTAIYYDNLSIGRTYYLKLGGAISGNTFNTFEYSLIISADDFGNTYKLPQDIQLNSGVSGALNYSSDKDVFAFTPLISSTYYLDFECTDTQCIRVENSNPSSDSLVVADTKTSPGNNLFKFDLVEGIKYYITIEHLNGSELGEYSLNVHDSLSLPTSTITTSPTPTATLTPSKTPLPTSEFVNGDVNVDGNVNSIDFGYMRKYLLGLISEFPGGEKGLAAADVDRNGSINSIDFGHMRNFLLGKGTIPPTIPTPTVTPTVTPTATPTATLQGANELDYRFDLATGTIIEYVGAGGDVIIPSMIKGIEVKALGKNAFATCSGLTSIAIPNSVTVIGDDAFCGCSGLTSITIPEGVTSIGNNAFYGCRGLTSIMIPEGVTSIGNNAFCGCSGLTSLTMPNSVTRIDGGAFSGCSGLTSITIPNSVTHIDGSAFSGCRGLTSITIPEGVTSIGENAFSNCSGLTSITIPEGVSSIGEDAFYGCSRLTSITIPEGIARIEGFTFYGCSGLTSITIPDSVTSIGNSAFCRCSGLTSITIPEGVTIIWDYAFSNCRELRDIIFLGNQPEMFGKFTFENVHPDFKIIVSATAIGFGKPKPYNNETSWKWTDSNLEYNVVILETTPIPPTTENKVIVFEDE